MSVTLASGRWAPSLHRSATRSLLAQALAGLAAAWRHHRAVLALSALDARGLADIGVGPGEIEAVVRSGRRGTRATGATGAAWAEPRPGMPPSWTEWR